MLHVGNFAILSQNMYDRRREIEGATSPSAGWALAVVLGRTAGFSSRAVSPVVHAETKVRTTASHCHKLLLG